MSDLQRNQTFAEEALKAANSTSSMARGLYLGFIALSAYIIVILIKTDDLDLFLYSPLKLPIINIEVQLKSFYTIISYLYFLMHINLLMILAILARKLHFFEQYLSKLPYPNRASLRKQLHAFNLTQTIAARNKGFFGVMVELLSLISTAALPIILLLWIQIDFLPAQEQGVLWSQRIALTLDCFFTLYFWWKIMQEPRRQRIPKNWPSQKKLFARDKFGLGTLCFSALFLSYYVVLVPLGQWERQLMNFGHALKLTDCKFHTKNDGWLTGWQTLHWKDTYDNHGKYEEDKHFQLETKQYQFVADNLISMIIYGRYVRPTVTSFHHPTVENVWKSNPIRRVGLASGNDYRVCQPGLFGIKLAFHLFDIDGSLFSRSLKNINQKVLVANQPSAKTLNILIKEENTDDTVTTTALLDDILPLVLPERSFRFINLENKWLPKIELENNQLQGARLSRSKLPQSNLSDSFMVNSELYSTQLDNSQLVGVQLKKANLSEAQLQNADLRHAELQNADLSDAQLQNADLRHAELQNADLRHAQLQNADLPFAELQNADLFSAQLQNADLFSAQLQNADLRHAQLKNADLRHAQLKNADLGHAELQNTDLFSAQLQNADLQYSELKGTVFTNTSFHKTLLTNTEKNYSLWFFPIKQTNRHSDSDTASFLIDKKTITTTSVNKSNCLIIDAPNISLRYAKLLGCEPWPKGIDNQKKAVKDHQTMWMNSNIKQICEPSEKPIAELGKLFEVEGTLNETLDGLWRHTLIINNFFRVFVKHFPIDYNTPWTAALNSESEDPSCKNAAQIKHWLQIKPKMTSKALNKSNSISFRLYSGS